MGRNLHDQACDRALRVRRGTMTRCLSLIAIATAGSSNMGMRTSGKPESTSRPHARGLRRSAGPDRIGLLAVVHEADGRDREGLGLRRSRTRSPAEAG